MARSVNSNSNYDKRKLNNDEKRFSVRYAVDANAALQPEYIPYPQPKAPQHEQQRRPNVLPPSQTQQHIGRQTRTEVKRARALLMLGVVVVAVMAFAVVMRNSQIYQNNRDIQEMGSQITQATHELNSAKQNLSAKEDMGAYLEMGQAELNMVFPDSDQYIIINTEAAEPIAQDNVQKNQGNIIDDILDWISSLERRG